MKSIRPLLIILFTVFAVSCAAPIPTPLPAQPLATAIVPDPAAAPLTGTMRVALTEVSRTESLPMLLALEALQAQGVDVRITTLANSSVVAAALTEGNADLAALNNQTLWSAIAKGAQVQTIMQRYFTAPIILTESEIKTCADLDGKPLGFSSTTGVTPSLLEQYLKENCPGTKPELVQIASNALVPAIRSGAIAGGSFIIEQVFELEESAPGKYHVLIDLGKSYPKVQSSGIHVDTAWAAQNPALVRAFIRELLTVHRLTRENPDFLANEVVKRLDVKPEVAKQIVEADLRDNTWDQNGGMTPETVQYTLDFLSGIGALNQTMTVDQVTDLSHLQAVLDEIGRR